MRPLLGNPGAKRWQALLAAGAIQSLGSGAALLAVVALAHTHGPTVQGTFSTAKARVDFLTSLLCVGLPQALFFSLQTDRLRPPAAFRIVWIHGLLAVPFAALLVGVDSAAGALETFAVVLAVMFSNLRGSTLANRSVLTFSWLTAAPGLFLLAVVAGLLISGAPVGEQAFPSGILLLTYLLAVFTLLAATRGSEIGSASLPARSVVSTLRYGMFTWISATAQGASAVAALTWIQRHLDSSDAVGAFSAGVALTTLAVTPLNLSAPVLLKHWTQDQPNSRRRQFVSLSSWFALASSAACATVFLFAAPLSTAMFGDPYSPFSMEIASLALAIPAQGLMKLWGVVLSSEGRPHIASFVDVIRFASISTGLAVLGSDLDGVIAAWLIGEYVSLALAAGIQWRHARASSVSHPSAEL